MTVKIYLANGRIIRLKCDKFKSVSVGGDDGMFDMQMEGNLKDRLAYINQDDISAITYR